MADPANPGVKIQLDRERTLKYTLRASMALKRETGKGLGSHTQGDVDEADMVYLAWALLLHEDRRLTPDDVADLLSDSGLPFTEIGELITEALTAGVPTARGDDRPLPTSRTTKTTS